MLSLVLQHFLLYHIYVVVYVVDAHLKVQMAYLDFSLHFEINLYLKCSLNLFIA